MKKLFFITFFALFLFVIFLIIWEFVLPLLQPATGRLSVTTAKEEAKVFLDGKEIGTTPFYSDHLRIGDHKIEVQSSKNPDFRFKTNTTLNNTTLSLIDLDLALSQIFSAGENLYFKEGLSGISLLSRPEGASVSIDAKASGKSPISQELKSGIHLIRVEKLGYLTREVPVNIENGYKLSALIYLAANPFEKIVKIDNSSKASFFKITNGFVPLYKSYPTWADGVKYTQASLDSTATTFDYLIDPDGKTYIPDQTSWEKKLAAKSTVNIGYLTKKESDSVSQKANEEWNKLKTTFN